MKTPQTHHKIDALFWFLFFGILKKVHSMINTRLTLRRAHSFEKSLARAILFCKEKLLLFLHKCTNSKSFLHLCIWHLYVYLYILYIHDTMSSELMSMGELLILFYNYENKTRRYGRYLFEF